MADLDSEALQARGLSASDVSTALQHQNVILPAGDVKIGDKDYTLAMNNSPDVIETINAFPIKQIEGRTVFMRDVAHVHDGFQVQTNSVSVNGTPGALMTIRKTGGVSTLAVIDGVRAALLDIKKVLPKDVTVKALFDQSVFVKAALNSVLLSACMAAVLTALVIILFLGNVRLSLIILAAIPLSIITAVLFINLTGQTLNTMTLGGFALAIGILVDNGTVVIENIERHVAMREPLHQSIVVGANEVAIPTFLSTLCICIVFVPVFLLQGTAKYLFSPLSLSVIGSLLASLALSFTMVPVLFNYLMRRAVHEFDAESTHASHKESAFQESSRPIASGVRTRFREISGKLPQHTVVGAVAGAPDGGGVYRIHRRVGAVFRFWDEISFRKWTQGRCACTSGHRRERGSRRPSRTLPKSRRKSGNWWATTRSMSCSITSDCRIAASISH
jgi:multidrug efflux pump subunit AcrB